MFFLVEVALKLSSCFYFGCAIGGASRLDGATSAIQSNALPGASCTTNLLL